MEKINIGTTPNDFTGDTLRAAMQKINANIEETIAPILTVKADVAAFADLATTYPNPEFGWAARVTEDGFIYSWNGFAWKNAGQKNGTVVQTTGTSTIDVMSQKAVTDGISYINVDKLIPSETTYTLQTAINALWASFRDLCKKGTIITFHKGSSVWDIYQFNGSDLIQTESYWKNTANWLLRTRPEVFFVPATAGISGINSILWSNPNGCTIELEEGTYSGASALEFTNGGSAVCKDCIIIGKGVNTVISRNTGYNDLVAQAGSNNIIKNCNFAHSILRDNRKAILNQCIINGKFTDDTMSSCYDIKVAASDSSEQSKMNVDIIAGATDAQTAIQTAINSLPNGGTIFLASGTYNLSAYINLDGKSNIAIKGSGYNTYLNRSGGYAIWGETASNCCISDLRYTVVNVSNTTYQYNVWRGGDYIDYAPNNMVTLKVPSSQGIAGINTAINLIKNTGGKITLEEGTYTGTVGIDLLGSNITIEGQGAKTIINRTNSSLELMGDSVSSRNNVVRNLKLTHSFKQSGDYPTQRYRLEDCIVNGEIINQCDASNVVFNIGLSYFYKNISVPYAVVSATAWVYNNRFEFHIHGHIAEYSQIWLGKPVDMVGHNALVELCGEGDVNVVFDKVGSGYTSTMIGSYPTTIKDIHFVKTGCFNYRNSPAVSVLSPNTIFRNCVFENASSSPSPFNNSTQEIGAEDTNGCRRHGISVTIAEYGAKCRTEFHDCIGIASPYGFQSSRGWYLMSGTPKLFNCIGYGGGIGEFGHGIISHDASAAELFSCVAYAGEHTYRQGAGFRYQAHGSSNLHNCVGYGSRGTQVKSNGVPEATIVDYCITLGITDTSFLYTNEVFSYDNLTIKAIDDGYNASRLLLGNNINNSDVEIVELGSVSEEGFGISMWAHNGEPLLDNCIGYSGHGINSKALHIVSESNPVINGGNFGEERQTYKKYIIKDGNGYCDFYISRDILSQYTPYKITSMGLTILSGTYASRHLVLHVETIETTPRDVIQPLDTFGISAIGRAVATGVDIPAGVNLRAYMTENGSVVTDYADNFYFLMITAIPKQTSSRGLYVGESATPLIVGATIRSEGKAIDSSVANIKVFDCAIGGVVDGDVTFASKAAINGSSNYSI